MQTRKQKLNTTVFRVKLVHFVVPLFIAACNSSNFQSDGFKNIKFGIKSTQLTEIGFTCELGNKVCNKRAGSKAPTDENSTLFGKPADIDVELKDGVAAVINVRIGIDDKEMIDLFSKAFGRPQVFEYTGFVGDKIRRQYWLSNDNTSVSVTTNLDQGPPQGIFKMIGPRSSAVYRSKAQTKLMLDEISKQSVRPKDL